MKKIFYYLFVFLGAILITFIACEKSSIELDDLQSIQKEELSSKVTLVPICHWDAKTGTWNVMRIPEKAAIKLTTKFSNDKYTYSPEGTWKIQKFNKGGNQSIRTYLINIDFFDGTNFSGTGSEVSTGLPVNVVGTVTSTGAMNFNLNWAGIIAWDLLGTTLECGGILEVHHPIPYPAYPHIFTLIP